MHVIVLEMITALAIAADLACGVVYGVAGVRNLRALPAKPQQPKEVLPVGIRAFPGLYVRDDDQA